MRVVPDILPGEFGVVLLTVGFIITIAPYAAGHDFGIFKIPAFGHRACSALKWIGPVSLVGAVLLHIPFEVEACEEPIYKMVTDAELCGTVEEKYVATPAKPKKCQHQSFGQIGWRYTEETTGQSGWMPGGRSQTDWCNSLIGSFITSRSIGSEHDSQVVRSSEDARWTGALGRTRQYNYSCTVKVSWEPIYAEKIDGDVCGVTPAVMGKRQVPASCKTQVDSRPIDCEA